LRAGFIMPKLFGPQELVRDVQDKGLCIGCGACVDLCPYFASHRGRTSQLFPCSLEAGRCFAYCPKVEVDLDALSRHLFDQPYDGSPLGRRREVLAARAGRSMPEGRFQGGGSVSAVLGFALKQGLIDAAALTDREGFTPVPRLATRWREVLAFAGSKFMAAPTLSALHSARRRGYRRLGLAGTPCQMTAVAQMRANPTGKEEHRMPIELAVGLFCNWALDTRALIDHTRAVLDPAAVRFMEIPPPPADAMRLDTDGGPVEIPLTEVRRLIAPTCFICLDLTAEFADLSIGMFEGRPGWNTLITRTARGAQIVAHAREEGFLETEPFPAENLEHLMQAAAAKKLRALRMLIQKGLLNSPGDGRAAVRMPQAIVDRLLAAP
jgi:coenzyme F420 hydrogenase subunit beta